jgi:uncharacterized protein YbbC (DUF1343 family)
MLQGVDTLVFDIQDVGARFYTYSCAMLYAMEGAANAKVPFYVLDRPNPITGSRVEGPVLDGNLFSNVGCYDLPVRHGLTMGEFATMANAERSLHADLHVVKLEGWHREDWFDATGQPWVDPSPNMRSLNAATLYSGVALLESSKNYSVGRGTDAPFEQIGADWIDGPALARYLNEQSAAGIAVYPVTFQPNASVFSGKTISGVRFVVTNRELFSSVGFGLTLARALQTLYPGKIDFEACKSLLGSRNVIDALNLGSSGMAVDQAANVGMAAYERRRAAFLLY